MSQSLRAARSVLDESQERVAVEAGVSVRTLRRLEEGSYIRMPLVVVTLRKYYEGKGIDFLPEDGKGGPGISWPARAVFDPSHRDKIRVGRSLANLSQRDFAKLSGVGQSVISRIESGQNVIIPVRAITQMLDTLKSVGVILLDQSDGTRHTARLALSNQPSEASKSPRRDTGQASDN